MRYRIALALVLATAGCKDILGIGDPALAADAAVAMPEAPPIPQDAGLCFGSLRVICLPAWPTTPVTFTSTQTLESPGACTYRIDDGVEELCIVAAPTIRVDEDVTIRTADALFSLDDVRVVFVATERIEIAGTLESWLAGPLGACPINNADGNAGGAGGSFATPGGAGGSGGVGGGSVQPGATSTPLTTIRDGCRGGTGSATAGNSGGSAGGPGGAIALLAPTIHLTATARLNASGLGGRGGPAEARGAGGGGSGGLILLDARQEIMIESGAVVLAQGGGGGEGSGVSAGADGARATTAAAGAAALGGAGAATNGGDGGSGGTTSALAQPGRSGSAGAGGGGGGGGTGHIVMRAAAIRNAGTVVPEPQIN